MGSGRQPIQTAKELSSAANHAGSSGGLGYVLVLERQHGQGTAFWGADPVDPRPRKLTLGPECYKAGLPESGNSTLIVLGGAWFPVLHCQAGSLEQ